MTKKNYISAAICLAVSVAIMIVTSMNFLAARDVPLPEKGPSVTEVKMLSDWFDGLKGTNGDTPVYVLKGEKEGGAALVLGGTHANEVSGYMSAFTFIENAVVEQGTVYVIPYTNHSAMTHNDPGEGNLQYFTLQTKSGERTFRYGSRATNPVDQWPDPDVYIHYPSGQQLSGSETRNINRAYPGRPDGNLTEKMAYGVAELIRAENVGITFDLHEASPEYPVINATVAHQNAMNIASEGCINLLLGGINMALEQSPTNFHGLTHRELGDYTDTMAFLMETANASQGRLRGATTVEQVLGGKDECYLISEGLGMLYVPWDENGHPIEERCGRHLQGIYEYVTAYNNANPDSAIVYSGVPGYSELFLEADPSELGGARLGSFLL
ncbi:succinylglutamate desuccinylase/aspartoacylase domain-containing protein [Pseudoflavonifractor phocaeensis]|uniref:succinylglutamate desuccinylase/aspartoacylase domain-containing protein n=1 Tax=Pseudoflavonifractor phocaeensis TaxID=1870988 RepID=UPI001F469F39|nr:succinylglutamate desuccinylase/aspartoacylase family protein [Pseudoflavonifractor phocaeensis]MCF2596488.1 succinylglutamate desuccinylase/aspartoacylase family protein [Pseudoflavonifractor phocaeensis]MDY3905527.1 succinylglutamate desuccinylase [Lawsonibacter sp.]